MRVETKIILGSVVLALFLWTADALLDYLLFYPGTFLDLLILRVPGHEFYIRTLILICVIIFGVLCSRLIRKQKETERQLKSTVNFQEQLINTIPIPVFYKDKNLVFTGCNKSFEAYLNMDKKEIIGKTVSDFTPKEMADIYDQKDRELINNPGIQIYEFEICSPTLGNRKVIFHKATFADRRGSVDGIIGVFLDITERQQAEAEKEKLIVQLQEALDKVKVLSGLIPICASCKKVRDDKGYWNQIESYIKKHSDAEFSHGLCPDCIEKLYPGYGRKSSKSYPGKNQ